MKISSLVQLLDRFNRGSLLQVAQSEIVPFRLILSPSCILSTLIQAKVKKVLGFSMR